MSASFFRTLRVEPELGRSFLPDEDGLDHPEKVIIPTDADSVEVPVTVQTDTRPGRYAIALQATANVNGFEEEIRGSPVAIEVHKKK